LPNACTTAAFIVLSIDELLWNGSTSVTGDNGPAIPMNHAEGDALCVKRQAKAASAKEGDLAAPEPQRQDTPK
jgi:hypothetical protein